MPIDVVRGHLKHTKKCFVTKLYVYSIHCVKLLSKHPEANFKHILGMQFAVDVIFVVLSSLNNDLIIYVFATVVGCEITYKGCTELNNVPYISAKVTCTINFGDKETWMLSVVEGSKYITYNDHFFDKKKTSLEAANIPEEYIGVHHNICFMVFPNNVVMTSSHIVINILLDLSDDQNYPLHAKIISFCFTFVLVSANPINFD